jgi:hypothetical protein
MIINKINRTVYSTSKKATNIPMTIMLKIQYDTPINQTLSINHLLINNLCINAKKANVAGVGTLGQWCYFKDPSKLLKQEQSSFRFRKSKNQERFKAMY